MSLEIEIIRISQAEKQITDSVDGIMMCFICRDTAKKINESIKSMTEGSGEKLFFDFNQGIPSLVKKELAIEVVFSSLRDFVKQEKEHFVSNLALYLMENVNAYYSLFRGNGWGIKLFIYGHFRRLEADLYELRSLLQEVIDKEHPRDTFVRENAKFFHLPDTRSFTEKVRDAIKPIKYVCGLAFRLIKLIFSAVSQIFWQGTPSKVVEYDETIKRKRLSHTLSWLEEHIDDCQEHADRSKNCEFLKLLRSSL